MSYIASLDQGTSSTRCMIFDQLGAVVAFAQKEHQQFTPQSGWVEHDADEIWQNSQTVIREAITKAGIRAEEIKALGITNQRETTVAWDAQTGRALHPAIARSLHQDKRPLGHVEHRQPDRRRDRRNSAAPLLVGGRHRATPPVPLGTSTSSTSPQRVKE